VHIADTTYVDMGDVYDFTGRSPFSVEAWVRRVDPDGGWLSIAEKDQGLSSDGSNRNGWELVITPDNFWTPNKVLFDRQAGFSRSELQGTTTPILMGRWYHIVGTYDGTDLRTYINGVLEGTATSTESLPDVPTSTTVGGVWDWKWIGAVVDEAALYTYALSPAQVQGHYNARN
jgi:hypothetical protein